MDGGSRSAPAAVARCATAPDRLAKSSAGGPWRNVAQKGVCLSRRMDAFIHTDGLVHVYHSTTNTASK